MKKVLVFGLLIGAGYWVWAHKLGGEANDPVYGEIRIKHTVSSIEFVGIGRMTSDEDCRERAERFWNKVFNSADQFSVASVQCSRELSEKHQELFANRTIHATYLALDRGNAGERDGRFIIYGVPSSDVASVCPRIIEGIKRTYAGKVWCVQGTIG